MSAYTKGPENLMDTVLFLMILSYPNNVGKTSTEMFEYITSNGWCDGKLMYKELSEFLNENTKIFLFKNNKYELTDYGVKIAMKVDFA
jgi:hypothetical protein